MMRRCLAASLAMLLVSTGTGADNPWKDRLPQAVERAEARQTPADYREALDVAWRADDWSAGLRLAEQALARHADDAALRGSIVRALFRAGRLEQAEALAERIPADTRDPVALRTLCTLHLARGARDAAARVAEQLQQLAKKSAEDLYAIFAARFENDRLHGLPELLRQAERLTDPRNGYPETQVAEAIAGVADFLEAAGPEPLNRLARHGTAPLTALVLFNLPSCDAVINGRGPYRLVVDTGGSILLSLDQDVADELGLKSVAPATVRGVSGQQECGQVLIDELRIGEITCRRVISRTFGVREAILNAADGILGTGLLADGRVTLDFAGGQLTVAPSSAAPGPGRAVELRIIGDAKLVTPATLQEQPALALLDTGADVVALAPSRLRQLFPGEPVRTLDIGLGVGVGAGELPEISLGRGVDLAFAGRTFRNFSGLGLDVLDTTLGPYLGVQCDVLVGMPAFREMRSCTIDFPQCRMWVDWLRPE